LVAELILNQKHTRGPHRLCWKLRQVPAIFRRDPETSNAETTEQNCQGSLGALFVISVEMHFLTQRQGRLCHMLPMEYVGRCGHTLWMHLNFGDRRGSTRYLYPGRE
jgi:hypothetical protein